MHNNRKAEGQTRYMYPLEIVATTFQSIINSQHASFFIFVYLPAFISWCMFVTCIDSEVS